MAVYIGSDKIAPTTEWTNNETAFTATGTIAIPDKQRSTVISASAAVTVTLPTPTGLPTLVLTYTIVVKNTSSASITAGVTSATNVQKTFADLTISSGKVGEIIATYYPISDLWVVNGGVSI